MTTESPCLSGVFGFVVSPLFVLGRFVFVFGFALCCVALFWQETHLQNSASCRPRSGADERFSVRGPGSEVEGSH